MASSGPVLSTDAQVKRVDLDMPLWAALALTSLHALKFNEASAFGILCLGGWHSAACLVINELAKSERRTSGKCEITLLCRTVCSMITAG